MLQKQLNQNYGKKSRFSNLQKKAMVMSRASGKNKYWFDVKDLDDDSIKSADFENTNGWKI